MADVVPKDPEYVLNHCTKYLARDVSDARHSYFGRFDSERRSKISESWRFPIIDSHDGTEADRYEWNDVTFVYDPSLAAVPATTVELVTTARTLYRPLQLVRVGSRFWTISLKVRKGQRHRYRYIVDGTMVLDPINPQVVTLPTGETWSSFFTWAYNEPITFERWEWVLLDRLTREILPFNTEEAKNYLLREANAGNVGHLYRLHLSVGVVNFIDKLLAREERHRLYDYRTCLEMIDAILRKRYPGKDPEFLPEKDVFKNFYNEMASTSQALFLDGWDPARYESTQYFLYLLRRHAWTGAFTHPKYGGNAGGIAWAYLSDSFSTTTGKSAFDWAAAIEEPLGRSTEYWG